MNHRVTLMPRGQTVAAEEGTLLLALLRSVGAAPDAPCGGNGTCGKCRALVDGQIVRTCQTKVDRDMTVVLSEAGAASVLTEDRLTPPGNFGDGTAYSLAFDIGTTTLVGFLLDPSGRTLGVCSRKNPQAAFGADVVSRIRAARDGYADDLTGSIRRALAEMTKELCSQSGISEEQIGLVCPVGNPAMQQLLLGISVENLTCPPFAPVLTHWELTAAGEYLPQWRSARLLTVPDISGFVGADTVACILATGLDTRETLTLLVDIGTNGEMVLGNRHRMVACSTAAGPALEGANISVGMGAGTGAIDHVWVEDGRFSYSVIGGVEAKGICGSGLIDAVAAALELGLLNSRGKIMTEKQVLPLTAKLALTQEDIRQLQAAKGAIAAGIQCMAAQLGVTTDAIGQVFLAGAFGTYLDPDSACRIGLLPPVLKGRITAVGNAAGSGAKLLACREAARQKLPELLDRVEYLELAADPAFPRSFAQGMRLTARL